jgi:hypothetical protein
LFADGRTLRKKMMILGEEFVLNDEMAYANFRVFEDTTGAKCYDAILIYYLGHDGELENIGDVVERCWGEEYYIDW